MTVAVFMRASSHNKAPLFTRKNCGNGGMWHTFGLRMRENGMYRMALLLAGLCLCGVSTPSPAAAAGKLTISFKLAPGSAHVTYRVPPGVNQLRLPAAQASSRGKQWQIVRGGAKLEKLGIMLAPHDGTVQIALFAKAVTAAPDRVYPIVIPYSDGSAIVNTAAFVPANVCKRTTLRFLPSHGEHVALRGHVYAKPVTVHASCAGNHDGGYVYLGKASATRHKSFLIVADPGAPRWIVSGITQALQKALSGYHRGLGVPLSFRPTVFVSYSPGKPHIHPWYHGDVLEHGTVRLSYVGKPWQAASSAASNLVNMQLNAAHEAFHLWNGGIKSEQNESRGAWLEEGGAQLAALLTGARAGWMTSADLLRRLNQNLQRCLLETGDRPWAALKGTQISGKSYYDCGVTFNFMAAALDDSTDFARGFFSLWRKLLRVGEAKYTPADFLRIATHDAHDAAAAKNLNQAIGGTGGSLSTPVKRLFTTLGIPIHAVQSSVRLGIAPTGVLNSFLMPLLRGVCNPHGRYGFWTKKGFIKLDVPTQCKAFAQTKLLVGVGGFKLTEAPLSAWRAAYAECRDKGSVNFATRHHNPLIVPCKASIPKPPRLLWLGAYAAAPPAPDSRFRGNDGE
jgi:hypothetical protein